MTVGAAAAGTLRIGGELEVTRLGYGAMRLTGQPGNWGPCPDPAQGIRVLRRVVELGVTLIDTAHAYGPGFNEALIAGALHPHSNGTWPGWRHRPAADSVAGSSAATARGDSGCNTASLDVPACGSRC